MSFKSGIETNLILIKQKFSNNNFFDIFFKNKLMRNLDELFLEFLMENINDEKVIKENIDLYIRLYHKLLAIINNF